MGSPRSSRWRRRGRWATRRLDRGLGRRRLPRSPLARAARPLVPLDAENLDRAERWFDRWEEWAVFLGRITPVMRSFISIRPASSARASGRTCADPARLGDLVLRLRGRGLGGRGELGEHRQRLPLRRIRDRGCGRRGTRRPRVALGSAPAAAGRRGGTTGFPCVEAGTLDRRDPARRRQGAVRPPHSGAPAAFRRGARIRPLHLRPRGRGLRARGRCSAGRPARDRGRERHRCARPGARGDGRRSTGTR